MRRLPGLDVLRAAAIVWVMLFHSWIVGGLNASFSLVQTTGWMGVDLFFVLSGYLIGRQLLRPLSRVEPLAFKAFYVRRSYRVLPAYSAVLALYFLLPGFNREGPLAPLWEFLTYTYNLFVDYANEPGFSHVWSLCVEEHFYLAFPFVAWLLTRRPSFALTAGVALSIVAGGMLLRGMLWYHGQERFLETIYYPTWCRLDGLLAGVLLAALQVYRPSAWTWCQSNANRVLLPLGAALLAVAVAMGRHQAGHATVTFGYPLGALAFALLVAAGTAPRGFLAKLAVPGVGWLATVSYSLYLIHKATFTWTERYMPAPLADHPFAVFMVYALVALTGGTLLHYVVEAPFLKLRDRRTPGQPVVTSPA